MKERKKTDILYIVMPAYNEEQNIRRVVEQWYPKLALAAEDSRLVVADSGSSDDTHRILSEMRKEYPQLELLQTEYKEHGPKLIALYDHAIEAGADFVFQTDSDGQTDPSEFERFWKRRKRYDAILAYRPKREDGKIRAFVERIVCVLLWIFFGVKLPDANAPFRLMRAELLEKYLYRLPVDFNIPNVMLSTYFAYYDERLRFLPIPFHARGGGSNSINLVRIVKIGWRALGDFKSFRRQMCG
ncbi:MAG: glycosyltransferase family 2 protein [Lachnospiraceae bacterium]|nr:glycosyltransferase family 2 protein [Lachnospiraceae bacterium]